jgi:dihydrofolate reductase
MGKLIFSMNTSLDGFIAGPNGELDWGIADEVIHDYYTAQLESSDFILLGRGVFEALESYWPTAEENPSLTKSEIAFARAINSVHKIVFSRTLDYIGWNTRVVKDNLAEEVSKLKQEAEKNLYLTCGPDLLSTFLKHGLIDEYKLLVCPVAIGRGKALFGAIDDYVRLKHLSTKVFDSGAVLHHYLSAQ